MKLETPTSSPKTGPDVAPTVRRRRSKRLGAVLVGVVIVAAGALGVLRDDGGSAGSPEPPPANVIADPAGTAVIPFPSVPPANGDGVSSVDG